MPMSLQCSDLYFLFVVMFVHVYVRMCACVGGSVGGLENVRNVEESNQNVPLCGQQQQKKQGEKGIL